MTNLYGQINIFDMMGKKKKAKRSKMDKKAKKIKEELESSNGVIFEKTVESVMHESMLPYSEHVILDRALPRVEDGLKPVQRRILYTMLELSNTPDKPYRKSARIVGDCLGKYHPHGDSSIYGALVRMAQDFVMGGRLVDGHGNFGSIDGDSAAAMRYTEVRLTPLALELLRDLDKDTVTYSFNFDDTLKEPDYLTGRFPNLLVNGASGIAVGLATNIPTHNLNEVIDAVVAMIDNPKITLEEILNIVKGPDFPTGGIVEFNKDLIEAYRTGRGKFRVRAKFETEELPNGKTNIIITELPYQVNKAEFLQKVNATKDKIKGELLNITDIVDESDKSGMRAVITLKKDTDVDSVISLLLKHTDMQINFNMNCVAIANGKPMLMGIMDILNYYINFQVDVIYKRTKYDLEKAKARAHILEGLMVAIKNIDEVISIIKTSVSTSQARDRLIDRFLIDEIQANAILDMRLSKLTNLETTKLERELQELLKLIDEYEKILASRTRQLNVVKREILDIKKRFPINRRTEVSKSFEEYSVTPIEKEVLGVETTLLVSCDGLRLKNVPIATIKGSINTFDKYNSVNAMHLSSLHILSNEDVLIFTNLGEVYKLNMCDIPVCKFNSKGATLSELTKAEVGEKIVAIFPYSEFEKGGEILMTTSSGMVKRTEKSEYLITKSQADAINLKDLDRVVSVEDYFNVGSLLCVSANGMVTNSMLDDVPVQKRVSTGVIAMLLNDGDKIVSAGNVNPNDKMIIITEKGLAKRVNISEFPVMSRRKKGLKVVQNDDKILYAKMPILAGEIVLQTTSEFEIVDINNIAVLPRTSAGKSICKDKIKSVALFID